MHTKKFWLVKLTMFLMEYEKIACHLIEADDKASAIQQAFENEQHNDSAEWIDAQGSYVDDWMSYRAESCVEVPWDDAVTLRKYL